MAESLFQNKQWQVDQNGNIICRETFYEISRCMLLSMDWEQHLSNKAWCNVKMLREAIQFSLKNTMA